MWFVKWFGIALSAFGIYRGMPAERLKFGFLRWLIYTFFGSSFILFGLILAAKYAEASYFSLTNTSILVPVYIGTSMVVLSTFFFVKSVRRTFVIRRLQKNGIRVVGRIYKFEIVKSLQITSGLKIRIIVLIEGTDRYAGKYSSDTLSNSGGLFTSDFSNRVVPVDVLINANNPNLYYVDIASIPQLTFTGIKDLLVHKHGVTLNRFRRRAKPKPGELNK